MSGQPRRKPIDASKFREQYIANLALEAKNNDMNYQANITFKKTGQTPTQPLDNRTTAEKLADIQRLKIDVRSELNQITDGQQAQDIVNTLNDQELWFLANRMPEIVSIIKPKYKYGVLAVFFVDFLRRYMAKYIRNNDVEQEGLQQATGNQILASLGAIQATLVQLPTLQHLRQALVGLGTFIDSKSRDVIDEVSALIDILPTTADIRRLNTIQNEDVQAMMQERLNAALQDLPSEAQVRSLITSLERGVQARDADMIQRVVNEIRGMVNLSKSDTDELRAIRGSAAAPEATQKTDVTRDLILRRRQIRARLDKLKTDGLLKGTTHSDLINELTGGEINKPGIRVSSLSADQCDLVEASLLRFDARGAAVAEETQGNGTTKGRGLGGKVSSMADMSKGIIAKSDFVPLGRYFIDTARLKNNIMAIKRGTGINVTNLPVVRVSPSLGHVMRDIVGGGNPKYEHLENLTPDEKAYLHKVAKTTRIIDRISIPSPNKSELEKDVHQFEVMKGEILAGNDNVDLVKKFKLLIMKLVKNDMLPKGQAKELLMELAILGY